MNSLVQKTNLELLKHLQAIIRIETLKSGKIPDLCQRKHQQIYFHASSIKIIQMESLITGLESFEKFIFIFNTLGPAVHELRYRYNVVSSLRVDQFFMTLIKLRIGISDMGLSFLFDISEKSVANVITTWIKFMTFRMEGTEYLAIKTIDTVLHA